MWKVLNRVTVLDSEDVATAKSVYLRRLAVTDSGRTEGHSPCRYEPGWSQFPFDYQADLTFRAALRRMTPIASCAARLRSTVNGI